MVYDGNLLVMLLSHEFTKTFLPAHKTIADSHTSCEVLNAIQVENREAVDAFSKKRSTQAPKLPYQHMTTDLCTAKISKISTDISEKYFGWMRNRWP